MGGVLCRAVFSPGWRWSADVKQPASGSHGHDLSRDHILSELQPA